MTSMRSRVQAYLAQRRALGFELDRQGRQLEDFARYADGRRHRGFLTRQLAIQWACLPKGGQRSYWAGRLQVVRTFAQHLLLTEPKTQIPPRHLFGSANRRQPPHLYSAAQIRLLLRRAGQLTGRLRPHTFHTLIGLLACTGLRISEALALKLEDVDLQQSLLTVRESKYGKSRIVPLHRTAIPRLRAYATRRQKLFPLATCFFVSERGSPLALGTVDHLFMTLRQGIPYNQRPPSLARFSSHRSLPGFAALAGQPERSRPAHRSLISFPWTCSGHRHLLVLHRFSQTDGGGGAAFHTYPP